MTRQELEALAVRCEQASGPDRELDWAIYGELAAPVCLPPNVWVNFLGKMVSTSEPAPGFTASLDAAMSLVPEGWAFEVTTTGFKPGASVVTPRGTLINGGGAYAATPALALTSAALRALSQSIGEGE